MKIIKIEPNSNYFSDLVKLELLLWPNHEYNELYEETIESKNFFFGAIINQKLVGFIQISIRYEYVNGTSASPVGYIEGIYVLDDFRLKGIARSLTEFAFMFVKEKGCSEIASDVEIDNLESQKFHKKLGFEERERVIYYCKKLK
jgi:aminoglycoside 6'-N-acetyltransferase I